MTTHRKALDQCVQALEEAEYLLSGIRESTPADIIDRARDHCREALAAAQAVKEEMSYPLEDCRMVTKEEMAEIIAEKNKKP